MDTVAGADPGPAEFSNHSLGAKSSQKGGGPGPLDLYCVDTVDTIDTAGQ
jgi:hypothetical protein